MMENEASTDAAGQNRRWRVIVLRLFAVVAISFLALVAIGFFGLRKLEQSVAFHPERSEQNSAMPSGAEDVWFVNKSGNRLHGWFFQSRSAPAQATVIYFHGNGGNITNVGSIGDRFASQGFNVLLFDYRGYGRSEGYLEDENELYADADAAYDYVSRERNAAPNSIVLYGHSLGTTAAVDLAARRESAAIIVESGLSSGSDMTKVVLPWLPRALYFLARNRFDSKRKLDRVHCPVLIIHGELDQTVPVEQARVLYAAAHKPKQLVILPNTGHNIVGSTQYYEMITEFMRNSVRTK
jgi:uncharacterized protein